MWKKIRWLRLLWVAAVVVLVAALVVERSRKDDLRETLTEVRQNLTRTSTEARIYEAGLLKQLSSTVIESDHLLPERETDLGATLYVLVDTECGACAEVLDRYSQLPGQVEVIVGATNTSPGAARAWLEQLGSEAQEVADPESHALFAAIPRGATPITLEVVGGEPLDLVLGLPSETWLERYR